jgi:uncharacterized protein YaaQ
MKVFVQMPNDMSFKTGDIFLERGFRIVTAEGGKAVHEDITGVFLRPASTDLIEGTDQAKVMELSSRLKNLAKEVESL